MGQQILEKGYIKMSVSEAYQKEENDDTVVK